MKYNTRLLLAFYILISFSMKAQAQGSKPSGTALADSTSWEDQEKSKPAKHKRAGHVYFSWGYNQEWYTNSTVHVKQDALGNDYEFVSVNARDHMGWNNKSIFRQALTIPQYSYRLGYYFNEKQDLGIELNFDHTKYLIKDNQMVRVKGRRNNVMVDDSILFSEQNGFYYFLNNGANFFLVNIVKKWDVWNTRNISAQFIGKVGVGPVVPHVENRLFGVPNTPHFQLGGWNTGIETAFRVIVSKYAFAEFSQKVDYARYSGLTIPGGTVKQNFGTYELILSVGVIVPTRKDAKNAH